MASGIWKNLPQKTVVPINHLKSSLEISPYSKQNQKVSTLHITSYRRP